ncbi:putative glucose-regulated protein [Phaeoacremonium minimum UCRPA7]|uniref:Putative glucose-regulated protein n=1 Tax=Phaeoacremonium minimum (strain UCR-PA7) TaxID=1286976 RepID=R8BJ62_PHAM7|nr:putative glucose-regulated protein [Phaeoacremonium minimum UCRPA7]EON99355.1 putative glucose-regulated protein [Phaeoacremonium minimum UCRPA7]
MALLSPSIWVLSLSCKTYLSQGPDNRCIPSYVSFTDNEILVGEAAKNQILDNPDRTIYGLKRLIGRSFSDPAVQESVEVLPYKVVNKAGKPAVQVVVKGKTQTFSPEEIPAYFKDDQRQAIKDAGAIIDLRILRLVNEPTAAAIGHRLDRNDDERQILVYDYGSGALDVSILDVDMGVFEILATASDPHLGGDALDQRIVDELAWGYHLEHDIDVSTDRIAMHKLKVEVERAKIALSNLTQTYLEIESFSNGKEYSRLITQDYLAGIQEDLLQRSLEIVDQAFKDANRTKEETNDIILAGGSIHSSRVSQLLDAYFDGKKNITAGHTEAVILGAIVQAGVLSGDESEDWGCIFPDDTAGNLTVKLIPRNYPMPIRRTKIFSTAVDDQQDVVIKVMEGERALSEGNELLGQLELTGILPAPRGVPQIEVVFELDDNTNRFRDWEAIDRIVAEADQFFEEDQAIRDRFDARYRLDNEVSLRSAGGEGGNSEEYDSPLPLYLAQLIEAAEIQPL